MTHERIFELRQIMEDYFRKQDELVNELPYMSMADVLDWGSVYDDFYKKAMITRDKIEEKRLEHSNH